METKRLRVKKRRESGESGERRIRRVRIRRVRIRKAKMTKKISLMKLFQIQKIKALFKKEKVLLVLETKNKKDPEI